MVNKRGREGRVQGRCVRVSVTALSALFICLFEFKFFDVVF